MHYLIRTTRWNDIIIFAIAHKDEWTIFVDSITALQLQATALDSRLRSCYRIIDEKRIPLPPSRKVSYRCKKKLSIIRCKRYRRTKGTETIWVALWQLHFTFCFYHSWPLDIMPSHIKYMAVIRYIYPIKDLLSFWV